MSLQPSTALCVKGQWYDMSYSLLRQLEHHGKHNAGIVEYIRRNQRLFRFGQTHKVVHVEPLSYHPAWIRWTNDQIVQHGSLEQAEIACENA